MRGGKQGKEEEKQEGGMRGFYGTQKVGLQHTENAISASVMRTDWLKFSDSTVR